MTDEMRSMLTAQSYAVVGASRRPGKYGALVYQALKAAEKTVFAVNPSAEEVGGDPCWPALSALPKLPDVVVMVVPPATTEAAALECARLGIRQIWMQPGAESEEALAICRKNSIVVVSGGPCIMVGMRTLKFQPE